MPFPLHHNMDVLNAAVVGIVEPFGQMLLQVWLKVLAWLLALRGVRTHMLFYMPLSRALCAKGIKET